MVRCVRRSPSEIIGVTARIAAIAYSIYDRAFVFRMGTGVSPLWIRKEVGVAYENMDTLSLVFCFITDIH